MKILITGGCGFIGSHLCDLLLKKGHEITVLDDLSTGCFENVQHLDGNPKFHVIIDTVLNAAVVDRAVRECEADFRSGDRIIMCSDGVTQSGLDCRRHIHGA